MAEDGKRMKRTPQTPYGSVGPANALAQPTRPVPATTPPQRVIEGAAPGQAPLDLNPRDEIEQALFGPTKLPNQPLTAGAPFGAGPMGVPAPSEDEQVRTFLRSLAETSAEPEVQALANRVERGE